MQVSLKNNGSGMTDVEVRHHADRLGLPNFKYYCKDELTGKHPDNIECGIINLDNSSGEGTHHTCYWKNGSDKYYFDSYGAPPPKELIKYLKRPIMYSQYQIQGYNDTNCSEWALYILNKLNQGNDFMDSILNIIKKHKLY